MWSQKTDFRIRVYLMMSCTIKYSEKVLLGIGCRTDEVSLQNMSRPPIDYAYGRTQPSCIYSGARWPNLDLLSATNTRTGRLCELCTLDILH